MAEDRSGRKPSHFGPEEFAQATGVSRETMDRLTVFAELLQKWQKAVNLIAPGDLPDLWFRHIFDSAQLFRLLPRAGNRPLVIVDLGSGAGFPGLVLAIMGAGEVHLIESDRRKCAFLSEAIRLTDAPAKVHNNRIEAISIDEIGAKADVVTARALAPLDVLIGYAAPLIKNEGICLFLKGQKAAEELTLANKRWTMRVEVLPSRTDSSGSILRLGEIGLADPPPGGSAIDRNGKDC